jgi:hypothetical protein
MPFTVLPVFGSGPFQQIDVYVAEVLDVGLALR